MNLVLANSVVSINLGKDAGTLTRANNSSLVSGCFTKTAKLSESPEIYGKGCEGSTARGVSTGKIRFSKILFM